MLRGLPQRQQQAPDARVGITNTLFALGTATIVLTREAGAWPTRIRRNRRVIGWRTRVGGLGEVVAGDARDCACSGVPPGNGSNG